MLERAAHDTRIGQGIIDQAQRVSRGLGVRVEEEENISVRRTGPSIHQRGASGAARPQESGAAGHRSVGARLITPGRDDDFGTHDTSESRQRIDGPPQRRGVAARRNDDRDPTLRPGWHDSSLHWTRAHGSEIRGQDPVAEPTAPESVSKVPTCREGGYVMDDGRSTTGVAARRENEVAWRVADRSPIPGEVRMTEQRRAFGWLSATAPLWPL